LFVGLRIDADVVLGHEGAQREHKALKTHKRESLQLANQGIVLLARLQEVSTQGTKAQITIK